jgi:hypothetical protein
MNLAGWFRIFKLWFKILQSEYCTLKACYKTLRDEANQDRNHVINLAIHVKNKLFDWVTFGITKNTMVYIIILTSQ